jgi:hypothetical protein
MSDRLDRLIADAAACVTCGKEHKPRPNRRGGIFAPTWASPDDGHAYRKREIDLDWLREWAAANPMEGAQ